MHASYRLSHNHRIHGLLPRLPLALHDAIDSRQTNFNGRDNSVDTDNDVAEAITLSVYWLGARRRCYHVRTDTVDISRISKNVQTGVYSRGDKGMNISLRNGELFIEVKDYDYDDGIPYSHLVDIGYKEIPLSEAMDMIAKQRKRLEKKS